VLFEDVSRLVVIGELALVGLLHVWALATTLRLIERHWATADALNRRLTVGRALRHVALILFCVAATHGLIEFLGRPLTERAVVFCLAGIAAFLSWVLVDRIGWEERHV
jgi:predicted ferric reductase